MSAGGHISAIITHKARNEGMPLAFQFPDAANLDLAGSFTIDGKLKEDCLYEYFQGLYWTPSLPMNRMMFAHEILVGRSRPATYERVYAQDLRAIL
jgi:acetyl esterase/lipase